MVFVIVSEIAPIPLFETGTIPTTAFRFHVNVDPIVADAGAYVTSPEHAAVVVFGASNFGLGLTVTVTVSGLEQPLALKVNIYRTTIGAVELFRRVSTILLPAPGVAVVVIFVTAGRVQENTVPAVALVAL